MTSLQNSFDTLSAHQRAIVRIAALAATGDISGLHDALDQGLDAGLTLSEAKEVLIQLYAYAGFPRSLNALTELMKVVEARKIKGLRDVMGEEPASPIPKGDALLIVGAANQTKLIGVPAESPLFAFAPAVDEFLKTHLFGDIFERDNLDWQSRELATVSMLSAMHGLDSQLQSHIGISMNIGITVAQLNELARLVAEDVDAAGHRVREALKRQLTAKPSK